MGRRKIEIRAIKDDRNRSVTFLKRKGGLFKKAHELSVLCSVDVAVIIFGHNKKLYEFSSGDIQQTLSRYQYYGPANEHKGPADFKNKAGAAGDDDDDEEDDADDVSQKREDSLPPQLQQQQQQQQQHAQHLMPPHMQHHNSFQHVRQPAASASPPMPNGVFQQRNSTPQPPNILSRSNSRNEIRRSTSSIMPMQHAQSGPPPQNSFAYHPNPSLYNPHASVQAAVPPQPSPQPQFQHFQPPQQQQQSQQQQQQQQHQAQSQQQMHLAHQYLQDQRRQSQPPPPPPPLPVSNGLQPPPQPAPRSSPLPEQHSLRPPSPPDRRHSASKSQSIFTPIDEGGSMLARVFFGADPPPKREEKRHSPPEIKPPPRTVSQPGSQLSRLATMQPARAMTSHPTPTDFPAPKRSDTNGSKSGSSRPNLTLQIPLESEENESGSGSPRGASDGRSANPDRGAHNGIVLPPPSPSASALLSAGVSGPPNPFARPPPPTSQNNNAYSENRNGNNNLDTPVSALPPSRYMEQSLIASASPGGLFSDWDNWGRSGLGSAILPSPLTFPTPSGERPPNFFGNSEIGGNDEKRKAEEAAAGDAKRVKT